MKSKLEEFVIWMKQAERSSLTIAKYQRDVTAFLIWADRRELDKELVIEWKQHLIEQGYKPRSINSILAAANAYMRFLGRTDCLIQALRLQRQVYSSAERELTRKEYIRLLEAAKPHPRLYLLLQTICSTGIRVSELQYFTVEAVTAGEIVVSCKKKTRYILLPAELRKKLLRYAEQKGYQSGAIFRTRNDRPLDRSHIWAEMKQLAAEAHVAAQKIFPHNLRKLFARAFYNVSRDIAKLADVLGHSSVETTRIYIMTTGKEHQRQLERLCLLV